MKQSHLIGFWLSFAGAGLFTVLGLAAQFPTDDKVGMERALSDVFTLFAGLLFHGLAVLLCIPAIILAQNARGHMAVSICLVFANSLLLGKALNYY